MCHNRALFVYWTVRRLTVPSIFLTAPLILSLYYAFYLFTACAKELDNIRPKVSRTANGSSEDPSDSLNAAETGSRKTPPAEETAVAKHPVTAKAPQAGQSPGFVQKEYTLSQTGRLSPQS